MICSSVVFADKRYVTPRISLFNIANPNRVLRFEVFVSKDKRLRVVHLILDFEPISENFQEVGHVIREGDPRLRKTDVSVPRFLAREYIVPVKLPPILTLLEVVALKEETTSSRLLLEKEIDQFRLEEEGEVREDPVKISNFEGELDRSSAACSPQLIIAEVDSSSKEEDAMALNPRKGLRNLMAGRNKGSSSEEAPKS